MVDVRLASMSSRLAYVQATSTVRKDQVRRGLMRRSTWNEFVIHHVRMVSSRKLPRNWLVQVASCIIVVDLASSSTWNGVALNEVALTVDARLELFAQAVRACPHNLMSKRDLDLIETRHIPECRHVAMQLPDCGVIADVGSGGGFPGLVIAICRPDLDVHLIEATKKKAEFLFDTAETLDLDVTVHHGRAEELGAGPLAAAFPVVTARAVARLNVLLGWTLPLLPSGGELWAIKGEQWPSEVREARQVLRQMHASVARTPEDDEVTSPNQPRVVRIVRD